MDVTAWENLLKIPGRPPQWVSCLNQDAGPSAPAAEEVPVPVLLKLNPMGVTRLMLNPMGVTLMMLIPMGVPSALLMKMRKRRRKSL
jgi:hypothetical protein